MRSNGIFMTQQFFRHCSPIQISLVTTATDFIQPRGGQKSACQMTIRQAVRSRPSSAAIRADGSVRISMLYDEWLCTATRHVSRTLAEGSWRVMCVSGSG